MAAKTRILIAEDDIQGAKYLKQSLLLLGYEVTGIVAEGDRVSDAAIEQHPDLIVMDVTLNGKVDGINAAEMIRSNIDVPVIFLTAHTEETVFERAKATAPYAFLTKPFDISQLAHSIDLALTKHHLEKRVRESESRYRTIFEVSNNAMMIIGEDSVVQMVNMEFERLTGYGKEYVEHKKLWTDFLTGEDQTTVEREISQLWSNGTSTRRHFEASIVDRNGCNRTVYTNVQRISGLRSFIVSMSDISEIKRAETEIRELNRELSKVNEELVQEINERKRYERQLKHQANHDSLTGLPNRVLLFELMRQSFAFEDRHNKLMALMLLDLDNFKDVNDNLGHLAGDILLKKFAKRLQQCIRKYDTVGRIGGDEFVIVVNDISTVNDIKQFTEKVRGTFQEPIDILGQDVIITASIGIAIYPVHGTTVKSLMKMADIAMYAAKKSGRNEFRFFSDEMAPLRRLSTPLKGKPKIELRHGIH